jgi:LPXTG-motif cell wall-anchored protein
MKRWLIGMTLALVAGLLCVGLASAKAPVTVNVTLSDFKVEMSNSSLPAGTVVTYVITNKGAITHEMVLEKQGVVDEPLEFNGAEQEAEDIEPGTTRTVEWTIPEAGAYQLACHVTGHYEAGMKTAFTTNVAAAAAPAAPAPAPAAAPAPAPLPKTSGDSDLTWWAALALLGLLAIGGGLALWRRKA